MVGALAATEGAAMLSQREMTMIGLIAELVHEARIRGVEPEVAAVIATLDMFARQMRQHDAVPDEMPLGWNRPAPASTDELVRVLQNACAHVSAGDSFEGTITWTMPTDEPELEGAEFGLVARYRIGNLDGQGGLRVFEKEATP